MHGGLVNDPWNTPLLTPSANYLMQPPSQSCFLFDLRVMNKAITESGGKAADSDDLGTISYMYDDMVKNNGKVHLPFG